MCYECGENERNFPFKLCTTCYAAQTAASTPGAARGSGVPSLPPRRSAVQRVGEVTKCILMVLSGRTFVLIYSVINYDKIIWLGE